MLTKKLTKVIAITLALALTLCSCGGSKAAPSDTVKWINTTYAALTAANDGDLNVIGGFKKSAITTPLVLELLKSSWEVTDRASADLAIAGLLTEGHRASFNAEMAELKEAGILDLSDAELTEFMKDFTDLNYLTNAITAYQKYGENAIAAWDYCRILQLYGYFYVADLYTEQEALDASLEAAKTLQTMYPSWDDLMQSYLYGYQYWQEDDASDPTSATGKRTAAYETLKASAENPYVLDWNTPLTKTW